MVWRCSRDGGGGVRGFFTYSGETPMFLKKISTHHQESYSLEEQELKPWMALRIDLYGRSHVSDFSPESMALLICKCMRPVQESGPDSCFDDSSSLEQQ